MKKTILPALALAIAFTFASCTCKKQDCNNQDSAAAQTTEQTADTANAGDGAQTAPAEGGQYADFTLPTLDGKQVKLSDVVAKNKITMVDFWASWCGPCRMEMPHVVQAYSKFRGKGLEIVGVSLDEKKEDWENAVKDMGLGWIQASDLKGWECSAARLYQVQGIPACVLINQKGEIVGRDLRGDELLGRLSELLK